MQLPEVPLRQAGIWVGVAVLTVLVGAGIGTVLGSGSSRSTGVSPVAELDSLDPGQLVAAPKAEPEKLDTPRGMGSQHAGIALKAVSSVDQVRVGSDSRRAPYGSRLVAFEVEDWACETDPCDAWQTLKPELSVDGTAKELPKGGDTFVAVIGAGASTIDLVIDADGYRQSVSLTDDIDGPKNITLLSERHQTTRTQINQTFQLGERTSIALDDGTGNKTDAFFRNVSVTYEQRHFFFDGQTPTDHARAFLVVNAFYSYAGQTRQNVFGDDEASFVLDNGKSFPAMDLDPSPDTALLGFEIPASVKHGTFVLGGTTQRVSSTGVSYTSTLQTKEIRIAFQ